MSWRRLRRLILFGIAAAVILRAIQALRGPEAPAFSNHPSAWDGHTATAPEPQPESSPATTGVDTSPAAPAAAVAPPATPTAEQTWVAPVDGACPPGFPVKAKERSGIYHEPGMMAYERTNPDRCYRTAVDAQNDGFRAAKR